MVSCQFAFHYCFESLPQADCMLRNAAECLNPGGFFIGTTPDAYDIVRRLREGKPGCAGEEQEGASGSSLSVMTAGNSVYSVRNENFDPTSSGGRIPLFGARYRFHLEVRCRLIFFFFHIHFPTPYVLRGQKESQDRYLMFLAN